MKKHQLSSSVLIIALVTLSFITSAILLTKEKFIQSELKTQYYQKSYIDNKFHLFNQTAYHIQPNCNAAKTEKITIASNGQMQNTYCIRKSLFVGKIPSSQKYIHFTNINEVLDLSHAEFFEVNHLDELPPSSEQAPKIVLVKGELDETLHRNFYGIIITHHLFNIKGNAKFYGILYSSYDNYREERNMVFKKNVILNLDKKYAYWEPLPFSRNMLNAE
ncbi:DUF2572 family protein [Actinobacillus vicugnae]|uniref:DUF2572 family protein n=1 Tax=Actinobacillus vicugnae TaxID=2573093 RepID=UPI001242E745|nr:DUF2572 family protein [Actinobacillus vicugnae]